MKSTKILSALFAILTVSSSSLAVTVTGTITGLKTGVDPVMGRPFSSPSPSFSSVGVGSTITIELDFPNSGSSVSLGNGGVGYSGPLYPLKVTISGGNSSIHPLGFGSTFSSSRFTGGMAGQPDLATAVGSVGDVGNVAAVFCSSVTFESAQGLAFAGYNGLGDISDLAELALANNRFIGGTVVLLDNIGLGVQPHAWGYSFVLVPEPMTMVNCALGLCLFLNRRQKRVLSQASAPK